mgnify:CR=1 FL=1
MPDALSRIDARVRSIAILEDNPDSARLMRRLLQAHSNYTIHEAADGLAGLQLIRERRPDLVILDLMMPGLDGFGVVDALRASIAPLISLILMANSPPKPNTALSKHMARTPCSVVSSVLLPEIFRSAAIIAASSSQTATSP